MADSKLVIRVFDTEGLIEELFDEVLRHLTLTQLLAVECVSKRWQRSVFRVLTRIKTLAISHSPINPVTYHKFCTFDNHRFLRSSSVVLTQMTKPPLDIRVRTICKLLRHLPNLIAVFLPQLCEDAEQVQEVLPNCPKLEHVEFFDILDGAHRYLIDSKNANLRHELMPQLTCVSGKYHREMTNLKFFDGLFEQTDDSMPDIEAMFKNGLRGFNGTFEPSAVHLSELFAEFSSKLEILKIYIPNEERLGHVVLDVQNVKSLEYNGYQRVDLVNLKEAKSLRELFWIYQTHNFEKFYETLSDVGHQLMSLEVQLASTVYRFKEPPPFNMCSAGLREAKTIVELCPNLSTLAFYPDITKTTLKTFTKLTKLRKIWINFYDYAIDDVVEFLNQMPQLRVVAGEIKDADRDQFKERVFTNIDFYITFQYYNDYCWSRLRMTDAYHEYCNRYVTCESNN